MTQQLVFLRPPQDEEELWWTVRALWGVVIPRTKVCPDHVPPFEAFSHAFFAKPPNYAMWWASRGSGKSFMLAVLALTKALLLEVDVTILGGSMSQSQNVHRHVERLLNRPGAPKWAISKNTATEVLTTAGATIRPLAASPTTVRGPHPAMTLLDEIDEMERSIYDAAQGQAQETTNRSGEHVREYTVASSTWQNPEGTFTELRREAHENNLPVFAFCYRENFRPAGWLDPDFIERKKLTVPAEMFRVEFDLGEPAGGSRAFDMSKVEAYFTPMVPIRSRTTLEDSEWTYAEPISDATYAIGADWAKEKDFTVLVVVRTDTPIRECVYLRRVHRRPYPEMIASFDQVRTRYHAVGMHDGTGLGNVVHDLIEAETAVSKFIMVGKPRTQMLTDYITKFENGLYRFPSGTPMYTEHKYCSTADIWAPGKWDSHLPDTVAAAALCHRAAERVAYYAGGVGVSSDSSPRSVEVPWHAKPYPEIQNHGEVSVTSQSEGQDYADIFSVSRP
jgi:Terminase large subunit, T4likevirus-type, N-terminal